MSLEVHQKSRSGPRKYVFIVLARQMRNSQHWRARATNKHLQKSTIHNNTSNEEGQKPCWKSLGHLSKKQIRTSKICFYSLGWPNEKQSTLAGLPTSNCIKKAPFAIIHQMNEVKNHVGCLSKSIKKADQDLENICFYSLG